MQWSRQERAFACEAFFSNGCSIIATQRTFRRRFNIPPAGRVPGRQSIVLWVEAFRSSGSVKKTGSGGHQTAGTTEKMEMVREAVLRSTRCSAREHAAALAISDRSLRRILHKDLSFHPYKMAVLQKLDEQDWRVRQNACEALCDNLPDDALVFLVTNLTFTLLTFP